jgi:hypothetical protein
MQSTLISFVTACVVRPLGRMIIRCRVAIGNHKYRYVLILAHPRSGSTLLSHIIGSHRHFVYAGESYISYNEPADLHRLSFESHRRLRSLHLSSPYIVDKIVYDGFVTDEFLQSHPDLKCIILIRSPEVTLKSMMSYFNWNETVATRAYGARLESLSRRGEVLQDRALLIEYHDLIENPEKTLNALSKFLEVTQQFDRHYRTNRMTGQSVGDSSQNIWATRIIKTKGHSVEISPEALDQAKCAFDKCRRSLSEARVRTICT